MAYRQFALAMALMVALGFAFYPALWLSRRQRAATLWLFVVAVLVLPLIIRPRARLLRLLAAVTATMTAVKLYDSHRSAEIGFRPAWWTYAISLPNPFAVVLRRVLQERRPPARSDAITAVVGLSVGMAAIWVLIRIFQMDWRAHPFVIEHCSKAIGLFLIIQFLLNGLAAAGRLLGIPSTDFAGPFFLARTPAEFWRLYNRPMGQFFHEYIFKPLDGRRHPVLAVLFTFVFSGFLHEYLFDLPARRVLGTQMAFFLIEGLAVIATLRSRPRGWAAATATLLTLAFNLLAVRVFLAGMNAVLPFYASRPSR